MHDLSVHHGEDDGHLRDARGSAVSRSPSSTQRSATLPVSREPFQSSAKSCQAASIVYVRIASARPMRCSGPLTRPAAFDSRSTMVAMPWRQSGWVTGASDPLATRTPASMASRYGHA
ncbi:hypothetical protein STANM309S_04122 [Streptomyces tanashiensis]